MRLHFATTVRTVALLAALPACLAATLLGETAFGAASEDAPVADAAATPADTTAPAAAPAAKPFNPAAMPEVGPAKSALGYYYAELTPCQTSVLRRGFKLPLDALATAKSPNDLKGAVVLAPLPDPNRPLLAVSPAAESLANPFADSEAVSFRKDPLKALGALLGASDAKTAGSGAAATTTTGAVTATAEDDPFGSVTAAPAATPTAEVESDDDPFGAEADPFGGDPATDEATEAGDGSGDGAADEEDPFGDF